MVLYYYIFPKRLCIYFGFASIGNESENECGDFVLRFDSSFSTSQLRLGDADFSLESELLNRVYSIDRRKQLEFEIKKNVSDSEVSKRYSSIILCVILFIKHFLDDKTHSSCKRIAVFDSNSDDRMLSSLLQAGFDVVYPLIPFLYYIDPSEHLLLADDVIVVICGGLYSEIFYFNESLMECTDSLFYLSQDAIVSYFVDHIAENYKRKYGESLYESTVLSERIRVCCEDVVKNLQNGTDFPFLVVEHKNERSKLIFSQKHLSECYRFLCEQELYRLVQSFKCTTIALVGEGPLFEAMKDLHDEYHILPYSGFVSLPTIFQKLERYRLDILSNYNNTNLAFLRRFLGQIMPSPSSSSSVITCWKSVEELFPPAILSISDDGSLHKTVLKKKLNCSSDTSFFFSVEFDKPSSDAQSSEYEDTSTIKLGFSSGTTFDPFLSYSFNSNRRFCICTKGNPLSDYCTLCNRQFSRSCAIVNDMHFISVCSLLGDYSHSTIITSPFHSQRIVAKETSYDECVQVYTSENHPSIIMTNPLHGQSFRLISYRDKEYVMDLTKDGDVRNYTKPILAKTEPEIENDWKDFLEENPLEDQWVRFIADSDLQSMSNAEEEFEQWYASHYLPDDPIYSMMPEQCIAPKPQRKNHMSKSHETLQCSAFKEYPLKSDSLLSKQKNWYVYDDCIIEGMVVLYEGSISGDKLNGKGCWYYRSKSIMYDGEFTSNLWNGFGSLYNPNGTLFYKGYWKNGVMNGSGALYKPVNLYCCNSRQREYIAENVTSEHLSQTISFFSSFKFWFFVC